MLCTCQTDTLSTESTSYFCVLWCISIGTNLHLCIFVAEVHKSLEVTTQLSSLCSNLASINLTCCTIQRDVVTLLICNTFDFDSLALVVNIDSTGTRYAALTHTTSNNGSVRCHTATSCQDTFSTCHTSKVFWRCLDTNHDNLVAVSSPLLCIISMEHNLSASSTRRCWQTLCDNLCLWQSILIEYWVQQFVELLWLATHNSSLLINEAFLNEVHSNLHHCSTCTLTVTCLEEPKLTLLNGELHILHIVIVLLQLVLKSIQLLIQLWHSLFHRRILSNALLLRDTCTLSPTLWTNLCNLLWCADTSNNVLTLCIDKVLTIEEVFTITSITREANTCSRCVAHVTEYHCHNRNGCTPLVRNSFHLTIQDSTLVHPRTEHSADSTPQLCDWVLWEIRTCLCLDSTLEESNKLLQRLYAKVLIECYALLFLNLFDNLLEWVDILFVYWLHTENDVTVHLYETTIWVINEVRVICLLAHSLCNNVVKTEVEDSIHHTRHWCTSTRTYADKQWICRITEFAVHQCLDMLYSCHNIVIEQFYDFVLTNFIILVTSISCDSETWRHWHTDEVHLCQVRTLTTKCFAHLRITLCLSVAEGINSFLWHKFWCCLD